MALLRTRKALAAWPLALALVLPAAQAAALRVASALLATRWARTEPLLTWRFALRPDVHFHDGSLFTADDAVFSFERALAPPSQRQCRLPGRLRPDDGLRERRVPRARLPGDMQKKVHAVMLPDDTLPVRWVNIR